MIVLDNLLPINPISMELVFWCGRFFISRWYWEFSLF